jgi:hypothetical protein
MKCHEGVLPLDKRELSQGGGEQAGDLLVTIALTFTTDDLSPDAGLSSLWDLVSGSYGGRSRQNLGKWKSVSVCGLKARRSNIEIPLPPLLPGSSSREAMR